jgi:hypothetical protein
MKPRSSLVLALSFLIGFCALAAGAEQAKSQMYLVFECTVKPSLEAKFYDAAKEEVAFYSKHNFPYSWEVYASDDSHYYWLVPVADYADVGNCFKALADAEAKGASEYQALIGKFGESYEFERSAVYTFTPEFSIIPEKPRFKPAETNFVFLDIWYFMPGKEQELTKLNSEWRALREKFKNKIRDTWYCWVGGLGTDQPVHVYIGPDKDPSEFFKHNAEMWKIMGKEASDLQAKMLTYLRKREGRMVWLQPELSYTPKK